MDDTIKESPFLKAMEESLSVNEGEIFLILAKEDEIGINGLPTGNEIAIMA
ncbi:MAG: hypothetical protein J7J96_02110 [Sulfurimonas sp.]|nr:hypothetical protein [Sulfurimonas sp.]